MILTIILWILAIVFFTPLILISIFILCAFWWGAVKLLYEIFEGLILDPMRKKK